MPFCRECGEKFPKNGAKKPTLCDDCWNKIQRRPKRK